MGGLEDHWGGNASFEGFAPTEHAQAPSVAGFETGKMELRDGGNQVVTPDL
jgi:hypothetical protein